MKHKTTDVVKIVPLGGLGEIGLNCMVFEYQDEIIIVDCGLMFSDLQMLGVEYVIPDLSYLQKNKEKIKAYIITHAHEDHIGALPFALKSCPAPIYCTAFAQKLIEVKLQEHLITARFHLFHSGSKLAFDYFKVTPHIVTHSIVEAMALFIETPIGKVIFTGDFKIDSNPYYGKPMDLKPFQKAGDEGVLLLMSDSTNAEHDGHSLSEDRIYHTFENLFQKAEGLTIVAMFASNIARIGQAVEIAGKLKKKVALLGRNIEQNAKIAVELGYLKNLNDILIPIEDISVYERKNCLVLSTGSQGEYRSALVRIANNEHRSVKIMEGDLVIVSSKFIPGNEKAIGRMINSLFQLGADVLYESVSDIHVSGHANADELKTMISTVKPKFFMPIHGEYRQLIKHSRLAQSQKIPKDHTVVAVNGDVWELRVNSLTRVAHFEENRIFIEGAGGKDISKVTIKNRRKVAETGIVFSVLIRNTVTGALLGGPEIISKGLVEEDTSNLFDGAKHLVKAIVKEQGKRLAKKTPELQEEIRLGLRRYFHARLGTKPVVLPIVVDI